MATKNRNPVKRARSTRPAPAAPILTLGGVPAPAAPASSSCAWCGRPATTVHPSATVPMCGKPDCREHADRRAVELAGGTVGTAAVGIDTDAADQA